MSARRFVISLLLSHACLAGMGVPANAGTFDIASCSTTGADDAWQPTTNHPRAYSLTRDCSAPGTPLSGFVVADSLAAPDTPVGTHAEWQFSAPLGTSLARVRLWREAGKADNSWELFARLADGSDRGPTDCTVPVHEFTCQFGGPLSAPVDWAGLSTHSVRTGIACANATTSCAPGYKLHEAWIAIYRSVVTIDDPTPPTASDAGGTLLAGGFLRGNVTATVGQAADGAGIRAVQARVDGDRVVGETQLACDYTRAAPCDDIGSPVTVPVVTASIGDGTHTAQIGVVDAGGNFTSAATRTVVVDNDAPHPPRPASPQSITTTSPMATISWSEPPNQVSAITTAHVRLCKGSVCETTTQPAGTGGGSATLHLADGPGTYTASVALADAAGNHDPYRATHWTITREAVAADTPGQPRTGEPHRQTQSKASPRLTLARAVVARDRRTITLRGTAASRATGRVTVSVNTRIAGRTRTITRRATIRARRFSVRITLPSARWRTATATVRYPGGATHRAARVTRTIHNR